MAPVAPFNSVAPFVAPFVAPNMVEMMDNCKIAYKHHLYKNEATEIW